MYLRTGGWARGSLTISARNSIQGFSSPLAGVDTDILQHTNTCLWVHTLTSADLQLLPCACPTAVAIFWEWVDGATLWMPEASLLTPVS